MRASSIRFKTVNLIDDTGNSPIKLTPLSPDQKSKKKKSTLTTENLNLNPRSRSSIKDSTKAQTASELFKGMMDFEYLFSRIKEIELLKLLLLEDLQYSKFNSLLTNKKSSELIVKGYGNNLYEGTNTLDPGRLSINTKIDKLEELFI